MSEDPGAVLITGCSSGIGHETARRLAGRGWSVYATARQPEQVADLADAGCEPLALDVTDEASMRAAVAAVEAEHGSIGALVNNAGYSQSGRSRRCRWSASEPSSRPTSSGCCACASSCCRQCAGPAEAGSSTSARWAAS
jgi:NAD(P)-dependent dehydrogenase (short-subunit alcohol dehydrogenase family)